MSGEGSFAFLRQSDGESPAKRVEGGPRSGRQSLGEDTGRLTPASRERKSIMAELELIPPEEAAQIEEIAELMIAQLMRRYPDQNMVRRGVHTKDHGCVKARFKV